jgi:photosystem II stability/assembly factor-like uncharacterized protein
MTSSAVSESKALLDLFDRFAPAVLDHLERAARPDERAELAAMVAGAFSRAWDHRRRLPDNARETKTWLRNHADDALFDLRLHGLRLDDRLPAEEARHQSDPLALAREQVARYTMHATTPRRWATAAAHVAPTIAALLLLALLGVRSLSLARPGTSGAPIGADQTVASSPHIAAFRMVNRKDGWLLLNTPDQRLDAVLRTSDGGAHWSRVTPPALQLPPTRAADHIAYVGSAFFLDTQHAWLAATDRPKPRASALGVTYSTSDGGATWVAGTTFGAVGTPDALQFLDAQHGWLTAQLAPDVTLLFSTADGGAEWSLVSDSYHIDLDAWHDGLPVGCRLFPPSFVDLKTGWLSGDCDGRTAFLMVTNDGGQRWRARTLPPLGNWAPKLGTCGPLRCTTSTARFTSARDGVVVVDVTDDGRQWLYVTHDGGGAWAVEALPSVPAATGLEWQIDMLDGVRGIAVRQSDTPGPRQLFATADGGRSWQGESTTLELSSPTLQFLSPDEGWAYQRGGTALAHTLDGGRMWSSQLFGTTPGFPQGPPATTLRSGLPCTSAASNPDRTRPQC